MTTAVTLSPVSRRDFAPIKALVLNSVSSPLTKILYGKALDEFFRWRLEKELGSGGTARLMWRNGSPSLSEVYQKTVVRSGSSDLPSSQENQ